MSPRRRSPEKDPLHPREVTEDMLPEVDSEWVDTYVPTHTITVLAVSAYGKLFGSDVWLIHAQENFGFKRTFYLMAHGFLSRFEKM